MKATMQIRLDRLKAARLFASDKETRYDLNGVLFEMKGDTLFFVATDGHRLIKFEMKEGRDFDFEEGTRIEAARFIIPMQLIDAVKLGKATPWARLKVEGTETLYRPVDLILSHEVQSCNMKSIDGTFPDWERVIPNKDTHAETMKRERGKMKASELVDQPTTFSVGFNPKLVGEFAKVNTLLGLKGAGIKIEILDDKAPAFVTTGDKSPYLAVLMPMRV